MGRIKEGARFTGNLMFRTAGLKFGGSAAGRAMDESDQNFRDLVWPLKQYAQFGETMLELIFGTAAQLAAPGTTAVLEHRINKGSPLHRWSYSDTARRVLRGEAGKDIATFFAAGAVALITTLVGHPEIAIPAALITKGAANAIVNVDTGVREYKTIMRRNTSRRLPA